MARVKYSVEKAGFDAVVRYVAELDGGRKRWKSHVAKGKRRKSVGNKRLKKLLDRWEKNRS